MRNKCSLLVDIDLLLPQLRPLHDEAVTKPVQELAREGQGLDPTEALDKHHLHVLDSQKAEEEPRKANRDASAWKVWGGHTGRQVFNSSPSGLLILLLLLAVAVDRRRGAGGGY